MQCSVEGCDDTTRKNSRTGICQYHYLRRWRGYSDWPIELLPCGTRASFARGCRCDLCVAAQKDYVRATRENRGIRGLPKGFKHGLNGYRNYDCRCAPCTEAHRIACAQYRERRKAS